MKATSVLETIGGTPHIRFARLFPNVEVWIKSAEGVILRSGCEGRKP